MSLIEEWSKKNVLDNEINQLSIELNASESGYENLQKQLTQLKKNRETLLTQIWKEMEKKEGEWEQQWKLNQQRIQEEEEKFKLLEEEQRLQKALIEVTLFELKKEANVLISIKNSYEEEKHTDSYIDIQKDLHQIDLDLQNEEKKVHEKSNSLSKLEEQMKNFLSDPNKDKNQFADLTEQSYKNQIKEKKESLKNEDDFFQKYKVTKNKEKEELNKKKEILTQNYLKNRLSTYQISFSRFNMNWPLGLKLNKIVDYLLSSLFYWNISQKKAGKLSRAFQCWISQESNKKDLSIEALLKDLEHLSQELSNYSPSNEEKNFYGKLKIFVRKTIKASKERTKEEQEFFDKIYHYINSIDKKIKDGKYSITIFKGYAPEVKKETASTLHQQLIYGEFNAKEFKKKYPAVTQGKLNGIFNEIETYYENLNKKKDLKKN